MKINTEDLKMIEQGLVDSRIKETNLVIPQTHSIYALEKVYCIYCGNVKGYVSQESSQYIAAQNIIAVCDKCHEALGALPLEEAQIPEVQVNKIKTELKTPT